MYYFEARNIVKQFSKHRALNNVSIHVPKGAIFGLLGPNGAGKTTLIRIINRIMAPDSGEVLIDGQNISGIDSIRIGYLPEERGLYKKMKVGEQALYLARLKGVSKIHAEKKLRYWFEKFDIMDWWFKKVEELSKGMAQKIQFITTVLHDPDILIFDEPFSGFDPVNANILKKEVLELKERGKTIILSTHDMGSVEELCDTISLINNSETILEGTVPDIRQKYKSNCFYLSFSSENNHFLDDLSHNFRITETQGSNLRTQSVVVQLNESQMGNVLLKYAIDKVTVHEFREILPTMNEIFIKLVQESTSKQN